MPSRIIAGASGYSFKEWVGPFYPAKTRAADMFAFYSARLPTVEINSTFYRMPKTAMLENWAKTAPPDFRFSIKASRRITHFARLKPECAENVAFLYQQLEALGDQRGPVLFQLPPNFKYDLPRLTNFLTMLPADHQAAFEFRNPDWFTDDTYAALKEAGVAACFSEREDGAAPALTETTSWGYVRLRLEAYSDAELAQWAKRLEQTGWQRIYVYFMHEPTAPGYADALMKAASE